MQVAPVGDDAAVAGQVMEEEPLALAAAAEPVFSTVSRLPEGFDPLARLRARALPVPVHAVAASEEPFQRPEGSFGARAVGNAIHAFVERLIGDVAARLRDGVAESEVFTALREEVLGWSPAVRAVLRAGGLPAAEVGRATETVLEALVNLLGSAELRWLLLPHREAAAESAWRSSEGDRRVRLDRSFFAGLRPGDAGDGVLWIVDWKTGDTDRDASAYLVREREKYEGQLNAYAELRLRSLPAGMPVMLALCYPLLGRMIWWRYGEAAEAEPVVDRRGQYGLFG